MKYIKNHIKNFLKPNLDLDLEKVLDVEFELSTYCNANCPLCYRNYKSFNKHYPNNFFRDFNELINQINIFPNLKVVRLVGSISEPTLYPQFLELCKYLKLKNIEIEICTNGDTHNNDNFWEELGKILNKNDKVYFTICGLTQETHEKYRKNTSLKNIINNVQKFRKYNSNNDYAQCIQFDYNQKELNSKEFQKFINKKFSNIYMTETFLLQNKDIYKDSSKIKDLKPIENKDYFKINKIATNLYQKYKDKKLNNQVVYCKSIINKSIQIDIYGNIYPCYLFLEASKGELWNKNYSDILNLKYEVCKHCEKNIFKTLEKKEMEYII